MSSLELTPSLYQTRRIQQVEGSELKKEQLQCRNDGNARGIRGPRNVSHNTKKAEGEASKKQYREPVGTLLSEPDEFMAAAIGDTAWLKQSLKDGRDPNTLDRNGLAPIHLAALHGRLNCLQLLIEKYEVNVNLSSSTGWRPIHLTINSRIGKRSVQCLQYLLEKGGDPSVTNEDNLTPAHQASIEGSVRCLNLLVNAGGCIDVKDSKGHTPLDYAKIWGHRKCARIISSKSWKQEKNEYFEEMEKLQTLKTLKDNEDIRHEEGRLADKEFYGQLSFTNWLDCKGLPPKSTGPSESELSPVAWSKQPRKYIEIHGDWANSRRGITKPNSVGKVNKQPPLTDILKQLEQSKDSKTSPRLPKKSPNDCEQKVLKLPDEMIEKVLFDKPSPHKRPLTFKCHNIIDAQHKKIWSDDDKPLVEMYAHLSNSLDSSLFPKKDVISSSSRDLLNSTTAGEHDPKRIYKSMKQMAKPYRFPNITGEEYKYRFEIL